LLEVRLDAVRIKRSCHRRRTTDITVRGNPPRFLIPGFDDVVRPTGRYLDQLLDASRIRDSTSRLRGSWALRATSRAGPRCCASHGNRESVRRRSAKHRARSTRAFGRFHEPGRWNAVPQGAKARAFRFYLGRAATAGPKHSL